MEGSNGWEASSGGTVEVTETGLYIDGDYYPDPKED